MNELLEPVRILIAEDDMASRMVLRRILENEKYMVHMAENGRQACEAVSSFEPDLVLLDWHMPEMSGLDVLLYLKSGVETCSIPVIMLTSESHVDAKTSLLGSGAQDFISKPCDPRELIARIESQINWHALMVKQGDVQYKQLAESISPMILTETAEGNFTFGNHSWTDYSATHAGAIDFAQFSALLHPDDVEAAAHARQSVLHTRKPAEAQVRIRRAHDGAQRWHALRVSCIAGPRNAQQELLYSCTDIHDTRIAQATRTMLEGVSHMIAVHDDEGYFEYVNQRWIEYTGGSRSSVLGRRWLDAVHPDERDAVASYLQQHARWAHATSEIELRLKAKDGSYRWFLLRTTSLRANDSTERRCLTTCTDIEELKHSRDRIRDLYDHQQTITDGLKQAFIPTPIPQIDGFRIQALYQPVSQDALVGGDWYDIIELPNGLIFFCVGDVAGHGIDAALVMVRARQSILTLALLHDDPALLLKQANVALSLQEPKLVSVLCGYIDPRAKHIRFSTAGHPPPIVVNRGEYPYVPECSGIGLGIWNDADYESFTIETKHETTFVVYTDGVTEHGKDVIAGEALLIASLAHAKAAATTDMPAYVYDAIFARNKVSATPSDDVTIVAITVV